MLAKPSAVRNCAKVEAFATEVALAVSQPENGVVEAESLTSVKLFRCDVIRR